jgi:ATP-dependent exoDNAse (exonuclease V) alpha subunit
VINTLLSSKESYLANIRNKFEDVDYFIVDECSRINMHILHVMEYLKSVNKNIKFILAGDTNQCDFDNKNIMDSFIFGDIIDNNILTIKWHDKARYCKEYDTFLDTLLTFENGGRDKECIAFIKSFFKDQVKDKKTSKMDKNDIKITFTNNKGKEFDNTSTVHKAQGKTINVKHSIYEIERMTSKVLYTSLSRCSDHKLINIYI